MQLAELEQALLQTDPAALLVPVRVVRRLVTAALGPSSLFGRIPHSLGWCCDRQTLVQNVDEDELDFQNDRLLPKTVILLARPNLEELRTQGPEGMLLTYWRRLFHMRIHLALEEQRAAGALDDDRVRGRIADLGPTAFAEARLVLEQEGWLAPRASEFQAYLELAAVYFELRQFSPDLRATYFPALRDLDAVDRILGQEVDPDEVYAATRLPGAPDPVIRLDNRYDDSHDYYWKLMRTAERARQVNDSVRAAVLHTKAGRVAPFVLVGETQSKAQDDLLKLTLRMREAFKLTSEQFHEWLELLPALLDKADQGDRAAEAWVLRDLQQACVEHERKLYALDAIDWMLSVGHRPIQRPLSRVQLLRSTKHLRSAAQRLTSARLAEEDRAKLAKLVQATLHQTEERVRERFRPILQAAFRDVGLVASNPPEETALLKMTEELLDHIVAYGFLTFSILRDTISRNHLKMGDLEDPFDFRRGDPLIRLDRRLGALMDGVYQRGESYLLGLERLGSLAFGTWPGRFLCLHILLPFGGAYVTLETLQHFAHSLMPSAHIDLLPGVSCWLLGGLWLLFTYVEVLNTLALRGLRESCAALYWFCIDLPGQTLRIRSLRAFLTSWPVLLLYWYVLTPLLVFAPLWHYTPLPWRTTEVAVGLFFAANLVVNSRFGWLVGQALFEAANLIFYRLQADLLQGLFDQVVLFFNKVGQAVEYVLYFVNDWLRAEENQDSVGWGLRILLSMIWTPISFLLRLLFVVAIEPNLNPIKLVISLIIAKLMLPVAPALEHRLYELFVNVSPALMAHAIAGFVIFYVVPGAGAFLFWEIQENWKLYRANRPRKLEPVVIGHHGETMLQLLKPGFHSGTIPSLQRQLRQAESTAIATGNWHQTRTARRELEAVAHAVRIFAEREFLALLRDVPQWPQGQVRLGEVHLTCSTIELDLEHNEYRETPVRLEFAERAGWLWGSVAEAGWLRQLNEPARKALAAALTGWYKTVGVHFVPVQVTASLPPGTLRRTITRDELQVWTEGFPIEPLHYVLRAPFEVLVPRTSEGDGVTDGLGIVARELMFSRNPLTWTDWIAYWQRGQPLALSSILAAEVEEALARAPSARPRPPVLRRGSRMLMALPRDVADNDADNDAGDAVDNDAGTAAAASGSPNANANASANGNGSANASATTLLTNAPPADRNP